MKVSLNLLPEELRATQKAKARQVLIFKISITVLVGMIIITSGLFVVALVDSFRIKSANSELEQVKSRVENLKNQESLAAVLKSRLDTINNLSQASSPQDISFKLITKLIPTNVSLRALTIDKNNHINSSVETAGVANIETLFANLTDPKVHDGKVSSATVNNFSKSPSGMYRIDLGVAVK